MSYQEYWIESPYLVEAYRKAQEYRNAQRNQEMWIQGLYVFNAIEASLEALMCGITKSSKQPTGYMQRPVPLTETERKAIEAEEERKSRQWFEKGQM